MVGAQKSHPDLPHRQTATWGLLVAVLLFAGIVLLGLFLFSNRLFPPRFELAGAIRTDLKADYRAEPRNAVLYAPVKPDLIVDVLLDAGVQGDLTATVLYQMNAPVVTVTPLPGQTLRAPTFTSVPPTQTQAQATSTTASTPTQEMTPTQTPTQSVTPAATATLARVILPTRTPNIANPQPTEVVQDNPTATQPAPTDPPPVPTNSPAPTDPPPPTSTTAPYPYP